MTKTEIAKAEQQGQEAFKAGTVRIVPQEILVGNNVIGNGIKAAKAWYRGWDKANLEAAW